MNDHSPKSCFQQLNFFPFTGMEILCMIWAEIWPYLTCDIVPETFEGHPSSLTLADHAIGVKMIILEFLEIMGPNIMFFFFKGMLYMTSWQFPMSIKAIDSVCPQAIFRVRLTLCPSWKQYITIILPRYRNKTPFYSESNGTWAGECFVALLIISWDWAFEVGKVPISRKNELWSLISRSNIDLG